MIMMRQTDGTYVPHPDYYPTDLVTVRDVYGHRHRIRKAHLEGSKTMLPRFNQHGRRIQADEIGEGYLHRDNIQH